MKEDVKDYIENLTAMDKLEMLTLVANLDKPGISVRDKQAVLITTFIADSADLETFLGECGVSCDKSEFFTKFLTDDEFYAQISSNANFVDMIDMFETWAEGVKEYIDVEKDLGCGKDLITNNSSILSPFVGVNPANAEGKFAYAFSDKEKRENFNKNVLTQLANALGFDGFLFGTHKKGLLLYRFDVANSGDANVRTKFFTRKKYFRLNWIRSERKQYNRICKIVGQEVVNECMGIKKPGFRDVYKMDSYLERISNLVYDVALSRFTKKDYMRKFSTRAVIYFAKNANVEPDEDKDVGYVRLLAALYATKYVLKYIDFDKYATVGSSKAVMDKIDQDIALVASKCGYKQYVLCAAHETAKQIAKDFFNNKEATFDSVATMFTNELTDGKESSFNEAMFRTIYDPAEVEIMTMLGREVEKDNIAIADREEDETVVAEPVVTGDDAETAAEEEVTEDSSEGIEDALEDDTIITEENPVDETEETSEADEEVEDEAQPEVVAEEPEVEVAAEDEVAEEPVVEPVTQVPSSLPNGFKHHTKEEIDAYLAKKRKKNNEQDDEIVDYQDPRVPDKGTAKKVQEEQKNKQNTKPEPSKKADLEMIDFTNFHDDLIYKFQDIMFNEFSDPITREVTNEEGVVAYYKSLGSLIDNSLLTEEDIAIYEAEYLAKPDNKYTKLFDEYAEKAMDLEKLFDENGKAIKDVVAPFADTLASQFANDIKGLEKSQDKNPANPSTKKKIEKAETYTLEDMIAMAKQATESAIAGAIKSFESSKANKYSEHYNEDYARIADKITNSIKVVKEYLSLPEDEKAEFRANNPSVYYDLVDFEEKTLKAFQTELFNSNRKVISEKAKTRIIGEYKKALHNKLSKKLKDQTKGIFAGIQKEKKKELGLEIVEQLKDGLILLASQFEEKNAPRSIVRELNRFSNKGINLSYFLNADKKIAQDNNLVNDICNKCKVDILDKYLNDKELVDSQEIARAVKEELAKINNYIESLIPAKSTDYQR